MLLQHFYYVHFARFPPILHFYLFIEILLFPPFVISFYFFLFSTVFPRLFCQFSTKPVMHDILKACYLTALSVFKIVSLQC